MDTQRTRMEQVLRRSCAGRRIEPIVGGVWQVDWKSRRGADPLPCQQRLLSDLLALHGWLLLDVQEPLEDSPVPLLPLPGTHGVGSLCRMQASDVPASAIGWLQQQQWLALGGPDLEQGPNSDLQWSSSEMFDQPTAILALMAQVEATVAIVPGSDGDTWLVAAR